MEISTQELLARLGMKQVEIDTLRDQIRQHVCQCQKACCNTEAQDARPE